MCVNVHMSAVVHRVQQRCWITWVWSYRLCCKSPDMGVRNPTWALCKSSEYFHLVFLHSQDLNFSGEEFVNFNFLINHL